MGEWLSFLLKYILLATIGTAIIIVIAPQTGPTSRNPAAASARPLPAASHSTAAESHPAPIVKNHQTLAEHAVAAAGAAEKQVESISRAAQRIVKKVSTVKKPVHKKVIANKPLTDKQHTDIAPLTGDGGNKNIAGQPPAKNSLSSGWAVVAAARTPYYSRNGKFLGRLHPGDVVLVDSVRNNKGKLLAVCRAVGAAKNAPPILVMAKKLEIYAGTPQQVDKSMLELYRERAKLRAEIAVLEKQAAKMIRHDNPYADDYIKARDELKRYWTRVRELQKRRDSTRGASQMEFADELRSMKGRDITLRRSYDRLKKAYDEWNNAHPRKNSEIPEISNLRKKLGEIDARIKKQQNS